MEIPNERDVRRDPGGTLTIGPGLVIDPFDVRSWPPEHRRGHRLRRALHEAVIGDVDAVVWPQDVKPWVWFY